LRLRDPNSKGGIAMVSRVILRVRSGALPPRAYAFVGRTRCVIGRGSDCGLQVPASEVSRHHCLLEIDAPHVHIRDLGSRNGTFVNGVSIGRRDPWTNPDAVPVDALPGFALQPGDQLQVGMTVFDVEIVRGDVPDGSNHRRELVTA
jgi:pSer/pThr/pTyr-binding forkhead associated (FHA) protein